MEFDISLKSENLEDIILYNDYIDAIQGYRDRIVYILSDAYDDQLFIDSWYEYLYKIWSSNFSQRKSRDLREGEAELILGFVINLKMERKSLHERIKRFAVNLDNKMQSISRKISVLTQVYQHTQPRPDTKDLYHEKKASIEETKARLAKKREEIHDKTFEPKSGWDQIGKKEGP